MYQRFSELPQKIAMTDLSRQVNPLDQIAQLTRGDALIFRHYEWPARKRFSEGAALRQTCLENGILFLVAGDARLALALRADGIHLPRWARERHYQWPRGDRPAWLVSGAAHNERELHALRDCGANIAIVSPVFPTLSHPEKRPLGILRFAAMATWSPLPLYALGGVDQGGARRLCDTALAGTAFVSAVNNLPEHN